MRVIVSTRGLLMDGGAGHLWQLPLVDMPLGPESTVMKVWTLCLLFFFPLWALAEDTVAEDLNLHELQRLVDLLTNKECRDLLVALSQPEENIFQLLVRLSPEKNPLDLPPLAKRDTLSSSSSSSGMSEAQCREDLTEWLLTYSEQIYYDRLTRSLQHIGRTDVAIEMGTNINDDKIENLKLYASEYHKYVSLLNISTIGSYTKTEDGDQRIVKRNIKDLTWEDLDLVVEQAPVPQYQRGPSEVALPFALGLLLGSAGTFILVLLLFYVFR